jgi:uncharacterized protein YdaU (DUF1376 family)
MSRADIWMPLFIGDYLADTMSLEAREHGAYLLLIMHYWRNGPLPDDDRALAGIARVDRKTWAADTGPIVREFFTADSGRLHHKRIDAERSRAGGIQSRSEGRGVAGAKAKWGDQSGAGATRSERLAEARQKGRHTPDEWKSLLDFCGNACVRCGANRVEIVKDHIQPIYQGGSDAIDNLQPLCVRCNSSKGPDASDHRPNGWKDACKTPAKTPANACMTPVPSPSPSQSEKTEKKEITPKPPSGLAGDDDPGFAAFWSVYPRKDDKGHARKAWVKAIRKAPPEAIIAGCRGYPFKEARDFQPMPATWLNGERWLQAAEDDGLDPVLRAAGVTQADIDQQFGTSTNQTLFPTRFIQ